MKVIILGARSYIGKSLTDFFFNSESCKDWIIIPTSRYDLMIGPPDNYDYSRYNIDCFNYDSLAYVFEREKPDFVINTATKGGRRWLKDDSTVLDDNLQMFFNIWGLRRNYGKLINFTSVAEFAKNQTTRESELPYKIPTSPKYYGLSKLIMSAIEDKQLLNLRLVGTFGGRHDNTSFIHHCLINKKIEINQNRLFSYNYIDNLSELVINCINTNEDGTINVTTNDDLYSLHNIAIACGLQEDDITYTDKLNIDYPRLLTKGKISDLLDNPISLEEGISRFRKTLEELELNNNYV